jgi:hypothetical protein
MLGWHSRFGCLSSCGTSSLTNLAESRWHVMVLRTLVESCLAPR